MAGVAVKPREGEVEELIHTHSHGRIRSLAVFVLHGRISSPLDQEV